MLHVEYRKVEALIPYARNPRTHTAEQVAKIAASNLGLIHRDNEVVPYWDGWPGWMRTQGWRRFAWYVWDQGPGLPGDWQGRLAPSFEFIFHFNRHSRKPHKTVPCKHAGQESHLRADGSSTAMRSKDGSVNDWAHRGLPTQETRIPDSVIRVVRHKGKIGQDTRWTWRAKAMPSRWRKPARAPSRGARSSSSRRRRSPVPVRSSASSRPPSPPLGGHRATDTRAFLTARRGGRPAVTSQPSSVA